MAKYTYLISVDDYKLLLDAYKIKNIAKDIGLEGEGQLEYLSLKPFQILDFSDFLIVSDVFEYIRGTIEEIGNVEALQMFAPVVSSSKEAIGYANLGFSIVTIRSKVGADQWWYNINGKLHRISKKHFEEYLGTGLNPPDTLLY